VSAINRLSADRLKVLMQIRLRPSLENFRFATAVANWKKLKTDISFEAKSKLLK
jgi:hypothetical protein